MPAIHHRQDALRIIAHPELYCHRPLLFRIAWMILTGRPVVIRGGRA